MDMNKELTREKAFIKFENKTFNENVIRQNRQLVEQIKKWKLEDISEYNKIEDRPIVMPDWKNVAALSLINPIYGFYLLVQQWI